MNFQQGQIYRHFIQVPFGATHAGILRFNLTTKMFEIDLNRFFGKKKKSVSVVIRQKITGITVHWSMFRHQHSIDINHTEIRKKIKFIVLTY